MKSPLLTLAVVLSLVFIRGNAAAADVEKLGAFSFQPAPQLSIKREIPGFKLPFFFAPPKDGFAPNLNFVEEALVGEWNGYVTASIDGIKNGLKAEILEPAASFELASKLPCQRFVYRHTRTGKDIRAICFLIHLQPQQALIATFSALSADGDRWDSAAAESIRTVAALPK